ncbi:MAG TPA: hypothetical protein VHN39_00610 [Phenylobacterium sp.]|jgi:hypothetical protein|nr:hypothetical protein [Phenylobacterium sp.]
MKNANLLLALSLSPAVASGAYAESPGFNALLAQVLAKACS